MNHRDTTLNRLNQYKKLQNQFTALCAALVQALPAGNEYGIVIGSGNQISKDIEILSHPCRLTFGLRIVSESALGKVTFQRLLPQEQTANFLTVYFDTLGNARDAPDHESLPYPINSAEFVDWLIIRVLEEFFKDLATTEQPQAT